MKIEQLDKIEKIIKPLIEPYTKTIDFLDFLPFGSDAHCKQQGICFNCEYSLGFYDDVDVICACGFAGNEHLCPIIQDKLNITIENYKNTQEQIRSILNG